MLLKALKWSNRFHPSEKNNYFTFQVLANTGKQACIYMQNHKIAESKFVADLKIFYKVLSQKYVVILAYEFISWL